jgi:hypothetical protein
MSAPADGADHKTVWVVSFQVNADGLFLDYAVDAFDLEKHPGAFSKLSGLMGKGVFTDYEEAEEWAKQQLAGCSRGCGGKGCAGGCCANRTPRP